MKRTIILSLFCFVSICLLATDIQDEFDTANQLYEDGKYSEALNLYLQVEKSMNHWKLFYNMGNSYFKLGQYVKAKIYYLRTKKLKPFLQSLEKNITIVNKQFKDKIKPKKPDFVGRTLARIESVISVNSISVMLVIFILFLNVFIFILFKKGKKKWIIYGLSVFLLLSFFTSIYHIYRVKKQNMNDTAVIINNNSQLRSGPGDNNTVLFKVNPGLEVNIIYKSRDWFQVSASSEIAGWINVADLEII